MATTRKHPRHVGKYTMTPLLGGTVQDRLTFDLGSSPADATTSPSGFLRATELATGSVTVTILEQPTGASGFDTLTGTVFSGTERVRNRQVATGEGIGVVIVLNAAQTEGLYLIEVRFSTTLNRDLDFAFTLEVDSYES